MKRKQLVVYPFYVFLVVIMITSLNCSAGNESQSEKGQDQLPPVVLQVGPVEYSLLEVEWAFQQIYGDIPDLNDPERALSAIVHQLKSEAIMYLEGVEAGFENNSIIKNRRNVVLREYIARRHASTGGPGRSFMPTDEEVQKRLPETWEYISVSQIVLPTHTKALEIHEGLSAKDFEETAKQYSIGPTAAKGGKISQFFFRGEAPIYSHSLHDWLFSYKKGQITKPILITGMGWTIFRVDDRKPLTEEQVRESTYALKKNMAVEKKALWEKEVLEKYEPVIFPDALMVAVNSEKEVPLNDLTVAKIGPISISWGELKYYQEWTKTEADTAQEWDGVLRRMARNMPFYADALETGTLDHPEIQVTMEYFRRKLIADAYQETLWEGLDVKDSEIWDWYRRAISSASNSRKGKLGWYDLNTIYIETAEDADKAAEELQNGTPWVAVVQRYSNSQDIPKSGIPMSIQVSDMPWDIYSHLMNLEVGEISKPMLTPEGTFALFRIEREVEGIETRYMSRKDDLRQSVLGEKYDLLRVEVVRKNGDKYPVKFINRNLLVENIPRWIENLKESGANSRKNPHSRAH